jgi:hypothetical protein
MNFSLEGNSVKDNLVLHALVYCTGVNTRLRRLSRVGWLLRLRAQQPHRFFWFLFFLFFFIFLFFKSLIKAYRAKPYARPYLRCGT